VSFASYGSSAFFKNTLWVTVLPGMVLNRFFKVHIDLLTMLHDGWVTSSPREVKIFWGLNVGYGQKWPYQHLVPIYTQLSTGKN
jgi:hypothetical protein